MKPEYYIGIDPGVTTGFAVWNRKDKSFEMIGSGKILDVMRKLEIYPVLHRCEFVIENPSLRKWFGKSGRERLQGAGSIKRDYSIWLEWFEHNGATFRGIAPKVIKTKLDAAQFKKITGYAERTNSHSRDAAMMVYNF